MLSLLLLLITNHLLGKQFIFSQPAVSPNSTLVQLTEAANRVPSQRYLNPKSVYFFPIRPTTWSWIKIILIPYSHFFMAWRCDPNLVNRVLIPFSILHRRCRPRDGSHSSVAPPSQVLVSSICVQFPSISAHACLPCGCPAACSWTSSMREASSCGSSHCCACSTLASVFPHSSLRSASATMAARWWSTRSCWQLSLGLQPWMRLIFAYSPFLHCGMLHMTKSNHPNKGHLHGSLDKCLCTTNQPLHVFCYTITTMIFLVVINQ